MISQDRLSGAFATSSNQTGSSAIVSTSMFDRNSSRGRNGAMSSSGAVTIRPSGSRFEEVFGVNGMVWSITTSQIVGPSWARDYLIQRARPLQSYRAEGGTPLLDLCVDEFLQTGRG